MTCKKEPYRTRSEARHALRRLRGCGEQCKGLRPYLCSCGEFHLGHLPRSIIKGKMTRGEIYRES